MGCEKEFIRQLHKRGFRLTPQREMVLSVMHGMEGWATAEEIYQQVRRLSTSVDISTVYRTLDLLQELHLVASIDLDNEQRRYELVGVHDPHLHFVCRACGQVTNLGMEHAQSLVQYMQEQHGFKVELDHVSIPGVCQACLLAQDNGSGTSG